MPDVVTSHNSAEHRYEAHLDGDLAGFAAYELTDTLVIFTHTEVESRFEGHGVGGALARFALDDVRATGTHEVLPLCPVHQVLDRQASRTTRTSCTAPRPARSEDVKLLHRLVHRQGVACAPKRGRLHSPSTDLPGGLGVSALGLSLSEGGPRVARESGNKSSCRQVGDQRMRSVG